MQPPPFVPVRPFDISTPAHEREETRTFDRGQPGIGNPPRNILKQSPFQPPSLYRPKPLSSDAHRPASKSGLLAFLTMDPTYNES